MRRGRHVPVDPTRGSHAPQEQELAVMFGIAAAQALGNGAMNYAAKAIVMPAEASPLPALEDARQIVAEDGALLVSSAMAGALKDLQVAAVAFTVQATISNYRVDPAEFQQLEEMLVARLERRGAVRLSLVYGLIEAAQTLGSRAIDYAREIVSAEDNKAPIGSEAVKRALSQLHVAAIGFATRLAISEGQEPKRMRRIEKKLAVVFAHQEAR
jgi:hypothetical protein